MCLRRNFRGVGRSTPPSAIRRSGGASRITAPLEGVGGKEAHSLPCLGDCRDLAQRSPLNRGVLESRHWQAACCRARGAATGGVACFLPDSEERAVVPSYGLRPLRHSSAGKRIECRGYPSWVTQSLLHRSRCRGESGRASPRSGRSAPPEILLRTSRADRRRTYGAVAGRSTTLAAAYWP